MIVFNGVGYAYGGRRALDDVSFRVAAGSFQGVLGPNGAGKSTLIQLLVATKALRQGRILINGRPLEAEQRAHAKEMGVVFQEGTLDERLTVWENLYFHLRLYHVSRGESRERVESILETIGLANRRNTVVGQLSGGMKRRLEIARAVSHRPKVLVLDEPTVGLDVHSRHEIWAQIARLRQERGLTVLLATHYLEEAEQCDRIAILDQGRVVSQGTPEEIRAQAANAKVGGHDTGRSHLSLSAAFMALTAPQRVEGDSKNGGRNRKIGFERRLR